MIDGMFFCAGMFFFSVLFFFCILFTSYICSEFRRPLGNRSNTSYVAIIPPAAAVCDSANRTFMVTS